MIPAVLVPIRVDHGQDVHIEPVQQTIVLPLGLHHAVDQVGHRGWTHPLTKMGVLTTKYNKRESTEHEFHRQ